MQIFANVAADPVWTPAKTEGLKGCWQFRAGEAFKEKDGQQQESTWYTVKDYSTSESERPSYGKGDFLKILGRLKPAAWMNRAGKPDTTLYVHAFDISIERKVGQKTVAKPATEEVVAEPAQLNAEPAEAVATAVVSAPPIRKEEITASKRLARVAKGLLQASVDDAPDWGFA